MASAVLSVNGRFLSVGEYLRLFFGRKKAAAVYPFPEYTANGIIVYSILTASKDSVTTARNT